MTDNNAQSQQGQGPRQQEKQKGKEAPVRQGVVNGDFQFTKQEKKASQTFERPRSQEYLACMDMIDFLSKDDEEIIERLKENMGEEFVEELQEMTMEELVEMISKSMRDEFEELETTFDNTLIGVLSKCYITGCDCHAIDSEGRILAHYAVGEKLTPELSRGREIFLNHAETCRCVEVYKQCCKIISATGEVETVPTV